MANVYVEQSVRQLIVIDIGSAWTVFLFSHVSTHGFAAPSSMTV